jgi:hypothetical protein
MLVDGDLDTFFAKIAGIAGAALSLKFMRGTWPERIVMAIGGSMLSFYGTDFLVRKSGLPDGLCGFLVGLFGMAICERIWIAIQQTDLADFVRGLLKK